MAIFVGDDPSTVHALFEAAVARDPSRPLLTFYDDASGERVELSGATLANWVAKTANLLVDGCGLGAGDIAVVTLPPHWQTAAVLLGCWSAGLAVAYDEPEDAAASVAFAAPDTVDSMAGSRAIDRYVLGLAPLGAPLRTAVPGWLDYITEVRVHGDHFAGPPVQPTTAALLAAGARPRTEPAQSQQSQQAQSPLSQQAQSPLSQQALTARAQDRASALRIRGGSRILVDGDAHPDPGDWLLAGLAVGASTVLCVHVDHDAIARRVASEQVDVIVGAG